MRVGTTLIILLAGAQVVLPAPMLQAQGVAVAQVAPGVVAAGGPVLAQARQVDVWPGTYNRAQVREMQAALNRLGFNAGTVDGIIGSQTRAAIRAYQRSLGNVPTGTLRRAEGIRLMAAFRAGRPDVRHPVQPGARPPGVRPQGGALAGGQLPAAGDQMAAGQDGAALAPPEVAVLDWHLPADAAETAWLDLFYSVDYELITGKSLDWAMPPLVLAAADLDGNPGNPTLLVRWTDEMYCQAGDCQIDIWYFENGDYRPAGQFVGADLTLAETTTDGFKDLMLDGTRLIWTGESYGVEPSEAPAQPQLAPPSGSGLTIRPPGASN